MAKKQSSSSKQSLDVIRIPVEGNALLETLLRRVNEHEELKTLWKVINVHAIDRLGITDHGPVHFQIVSNSALRILRLLIKRNITPSIVQDFKLTNNHAEIVVFLASLLHDTGMVVNREGHEDFSVFISGMLLKDMLDFLPVSERVIVTSETLHAIISHRSGGVPTTIEGGVVRVADALDMSGGRSRIPFKAGRIDIHSVSALAIEHVEIKEGKEKPVEIVVTMVNSAGIYQIDELLKKKLRNSGLEKYVDVKAYVKPQAEKRLVHEYNLTED